MNRKQKKDFINNKKGITLIALVVTIIVLVILAGVSINLLFGQYGIIAKAQSSKELMEIAKEKEQLQMAVTSCVAKNYKEIKFEDFKNELIDGRYPDISNIEGVNELEDGVTLIAKENNKINFKDLFMSVSYASDEIYNYAKVTYNSGRIYYITLRNIGGVPTGSIYGNTTVENPEKPEDSTGNEEDNDIPIINKAEAQLCQITINATSENSTIAGYLITKNETQPEKDSFIYLENIGNEFDKTILAEEENTTYYVWVIDSIGNISNPKTVTTGQKQLLSKAVKIGDYVAYSPVTETQVIYRISKDITKTTNYYAYYSNKKLTTYGEDIKWRVFDIDDNGRVLLISTDAILPYDDGTGYNKYLPLKHSKAYLYGEEAIQRSCAVFGHGVGADTSIVTKYHTGDVVEGLTEHTITGSGARSISMAEVDKIANVTEQDKKAFNANYGETFKNKVYAPTTSTTTGYTSSKVEREYKTTQYYYRLADRVETTNVMYDLLYCKFNYGYYLADRYVKSSDGKLYCGIYNIRPTTQTNNYDTVYVCTSSLHESDDLNYAGTQAGAIRPIVTIKANVLTSGNSENGWTIIDQ